MKLVLVGPTIEENLSVAYLAASLRQAGHEALLVSFVRDEEHLDVSRQILEHKPDAVGLSMAFQRRNGGFLALAVDLREAGFTGHLTAGGHWAALAAEEILRDHEAIDSVIQGEAEEAVVTLAEELARGGDLAIVPGIVCRAADGFTYGPRPVKLADLDELPFPVRDEPPLEQLGLATAPLVASRGCRARCSFCSIAAFHRLSHGAARRERSPEAVADEMARLWEERGVRVFIFHDDDFFDGRRARDLERIDRLEAALEARKVPKLALSVKARPDDIDDEVLSRLCDLGLFRVFLGVETDAPAGLRALDRRLAPDANRRALELLRKHDVFVCSNLLLWEPDTTLIDLRANLALLRDHPHQLFNLARTELYEGAPLTLRLHREERLLGSYEGRDYVVSDPRAELAWRLFRVVLGERCYPLEGVVYAAMGLACDAKLLTTLFPSERSWQIRREVDELVREHSRSMRDCLETIVAFSEVADLGPAPEVLMFTLDLARSIREEDAVLLERMTPLQARLERCARGVPEPFQPRRERGRSVVRGVRATTVVAATAGLLACSRGCAPTPPQNGDVVTTPDRPPAERAPDGGGATTSPQTNESTAIEIQMEGRRSSRWVHCQGAERHESFRVTASLSDDSLQASFARFESDDGRIEDLYIAPNGRRAEAILHPTPVVGQRRLVAIFDLAGEGAGTIRRSMPYYQYGENTASAGHGPQPPPICGRICDASGPPPVITMGGSRDVVFTRNSQDYDSGWAQEFRFSVGLRSDIEGEVISAPEIQCSSGSVREVQLGSRYNPTPIANATWPTEVSMARLTLVYSPQPTDGTGRLQAGDHTCTFRFPVRHRGRERTYEGSLQVHVEPDGFARITAPSAPQSSLGTEAIRRAGIRTADGELYPDLPLPLRFPVTLSCQADYGDSILLEADIPETCRNDSVTWLWHASIGEIEPVYGGSTALWKLPESEARGVAVCAVQVAPQDLQIGTYRRG